MASLWTSLNPARSGVTRFDHGLPESAILPAETLADAGFRTAGVWRNGWVAPNFGFGQGFEVYERPRSRPIPSAIRRDNPHVTLEGTDHDVVDNAIEFLRAHGHERWFLYVHLMDLHQYIYDTDSAVFGSAYSDVYDNSILHTDGVVARLLTVLAEEGLLEKTLVVITSDHGEAFSERGLEGHARHVYRETTEVPFILSFPFRLEEGVTVESRSRNVDVWPTLFDLLGLPPVEGVDGRSLVPEILAQIQGQELSDPTAPRAIAHLDRSWGQQRQAPRPAVAVVEDGFRYVYALDSDGTTTEQLFDGNADLLERENVIRDHPGRAESMRETVEAYLHDSPLPPWGDDRISVELDEMELNQLRALGYELP
jgi:arylsulfatase A-like enzyme